MIYIFLGPSGCGKGTQAKFLGAKLNIPTISTGEILRKAFENKMPDGIAAEKYWGKGNWVPNDLMFKMLKVRLEMDDCQKGFILDAFPREVGQAELLDQYLGERGLKVERVFHLDTDESTAVERILGRIEEDKKRGKVREDETPEVIKARLESYRKTIAPILRYYEERGLLEQIDNSPPIEEVHKEVVRRLLV